MLKVLVISDDLWHPGEVIKRGLAPLGDEFELDHVMDAKDILTRDMLDEYAAIVCCKGDSHSAANSKAQWFEENVTAVMPKDFEDYVRKGGGLVALHAGNCFREGVGLSPLIGNYFIGHPPQCDIEVRIEDKKHPITEGIENFKIRDEHYMINVVADDIHPLFTTVSETKAGTQTAGYTREIGKGRICCLTPGHNCAVLRNEAFTKILRRAIIWVSENTPEKGE